MKKIDKFGKSLLFTIMLGKIILNALKVQAEPDFEIHAQVSKPFHYLESGLVTVEIKSENEIELSTIKLDATQLGEKKIINISPELMAVTIAATHDTPVGQYDLPIEVKTKAGDIVKSTVSVEVIPVPEDYPYLAWDQEIIYFMLTDRFYDGDSSNNNPFNEPFDTATNYGGIYHGGDFKGITDKLDYLQELGVTMIWVTPIVQNIEYNYMEGKDSDFYAYHGYWASDFEKLNPHLGSIEDFHELIDKAEEHEIGIMVDVVLNHAGYGMDGLAEVDAKLYPTKEEQEKFKGMLRTDENRRKGDTVLDSLAGLPDFVTEDPKIRNQLVAWQTAWINLSTTEKGNRIRAYRVDTVKHVEDTTWQHFKNEIVKIAPDFHLIGEVWDAKYNRLNVQLGDGMMDSLLDFGFKTYAGGFAFGYFELNQKQLQERNQVLTSSRTLGQFLGSHDEDGFLYKVVNNDLGRAMIAATLQLTSKGQPVIYYGEEIGQSGANNWPQYDNRYDFDWNSIENNPMLNHYQKVIAFRKNMGDLLTRGTTLGVFGSKELEWYVTEHRYNEQLAYIVYNVSETSKTLTVEVSDKDVVIEDHYSSKEYNTEEKNNQYLITLEVPSRHEGGTMLLTVEAGEIIKISE